MHVDGRQFNRNVNLYFIALIPHESLRDQIRSLKERMRNKYGASHALKSTAHITLQMPFKRSSGDEDMISQALMKLAAGEKSFNINLDGFGAFAPRVIFIKISEPDPIIALHSRLKDLLLAELHFSQEEILKEVQPHITVATRDLTKTAFREAWPELKDEEFRASFDVHSIFLLKHNGRSWDIFGEFNFG
jgi:2'-5' RNA ligase